MPLKRDKHHALLLDLAVMLCSVPEFAAAVHGRTLVPLLACCRGDRKGAEVGYDDLSAALAPGALACGLLGVAVELLRRSPTAPSTTREERRWLGRPRR